jgi:nucleoside-diphosphate-sugar epimerase
MRALVLGGTGFIGAAVVRQLVAAGHEVGVVHRGRTEAPLPPQVHHHHLPRQRLAELAPAIDAFGPDVALDAAAYSRDDARVAVQTLAGRVGRLVALSSLDVYRAWDRLVGARPGPPDPVPLSEEAPLRASRFPRRHLADDADDWRFDYDKLHVEREVQAEPSLRATVLRLPYVFGPGDNRQRVERVLDTLRGQTELRLPARRARWRSTRGFVDDVAAAIALCLTDERAAGRTYNLGQPAAQACTDAAWIGRVGRAAGWEGAVLEEDDNREDPVQELVLDTSRLRHELGFSEALSFDEAIARTVQAVQQQPVRSLPR